METSGKDFVDRINELFSQRISRPKADFYESCDIPKNSLSNWSKRNTIPGADIAIRIAKYLNTTVEYLVTGEEEKIPRNILDTAYEINALPTPLQNIVLATLESCKAQLSMQEEASRSSAV